MQAGSAVWPVGDVAPNEYFMRPSFVNSVAEAWPSFNTSEGEGLHADDFISGLDPFPVDDEFETDELAAAPSLDLEDLFQRPSNRVHSMRTAFSMNDLQSLQTLEPAAPWHPRIVSVKPTLASVPEGGPPEGGHQAVNLVPMSMYHQQPGSELQPPPAQHDGFAYMGQDPSRSMGMQPMHGITPQNMFPMLMQQPQQQFMGQGMNMMMPSAQRPMQMTSPSYAPAPSFSGGPAMGSRVMLHPLNGMPQQSAHNPSTSDPMEHQMTDVKLEPGGWDTESSGAGQAHQGDPNTAGYLQPSGGSLRKSQSALELGAWKKIAQGDMAFVDPSGSVREQLQGLDLLQQVGKLTPEERLLKILRYRAKRQMRNFNRTIKYQCRKSLADTRPRVGGRFARDNDPGSVLPHETKKAIREKTAKPCANSPSQSPPQPSGEHAGPGSALAEAKPVHLVPDQQLSEAAALPAFEDKEAGFVAPRTPVPHTQPGLLEQHATLAQLYNQWSEAGAPAALQPEEQGQPEQRLLPCSSNSA